MKYPLYPQSAEQLDAACPYCGSEDLTNSDLGAPTAAECNIEVTCGDCGRSHHIGYTATRLTLETSADPPDLIEFYLPVAVLRDQGVDEPDQLESVPLGVHAGPDGLLVMAHGYGENTADAGYGAPLIIELHRGRLRVLVWDDINCDDPPVIVDLGLAAEFSRSYREPYEAQRLDREGRLIEAHGFNDLAAALKYARTELGDIPGHAARVIETATGKPVEKAETAAPEARACCPRPRSDLELECAAPRMVELARDQYGSDDLEVDAGACISRAPDSGGLWVQAWVWLNDEEIHEPNQED